MFSGMTRAFATCELAPSTIHDNEIFGMGSADLVEEATHGFGVHLAADHPIQLSFLRADCSIDIGEFPLVAVVDHRTLWRWRPTTSNANHAPKARLILEHQAHRSSLDGFRSQQGFQHFGEFFFQSSCSSDLLLG